MTSDTMVPTKRKDRPKSPCSRSADIGEELLEQRPVEPVFVRAAAPPSPRRPNGPPSITTTGSPGVQVIGREGQKHDDEEDRDQPKKPARNIDAHPRHPLRRGISRTAYLMLAS